MTQKQRNRGWLIAVGSTCGITALVLAVVAVVCVVAIVAVALGALKACSKI